MIRKNTGKSLTYIGVYWRNLGYWEVERFVCDKLRKKGPFKTEVQAALESDVLIHQYYTLFNGRLGNLNFPEFSKKLLKKTKEKTIKEKEKILMLHEKNKERKKIEKNIVSLNYIVNGFLQSRKLLLQKRRIFSRTSINFRFSFFKILHKSILIKSSYYHIYATKFKFKSEKKIKDVCNLEKNFIYAFLTTLKQLSYNFSLSTKIENLKNNPIYILLNNASKIIKKERDILVKQLSIIKKKKRKEKKKHDLVIKKGVFLLNKYLRQTSSSKLEKLRQIRCEKKKKIENEFKKLEKKILKEKKKFLRESLLLFIKTKEKFKLENLEKWINIKNFLKKKTNKLYKKILFEIRLLNQWMNKIMYEKLKSLSFLFNLKDKFKKKEGDVLKFLVEQGIYESKFNKGLKIEELKLEINEDTIDIVKQLILKQKSNYIN